jgi:F0F1-type ATP synthase assembly protein I
MTGRDPSQEELRRRGMAVYQGSLEAVFAILIATGLGYLVDWKFGSSPRGLIAGMCVGFGSFVLRLWRMRKLFDDDSRPGGTGRG